MDLGKGIEILNAIEITTTEHFWAAVILLILGIIVIFVSVQLVLETEKPSFFLLSLIGGLFMIGSNAIKGLYFNQPTGTYEYQVTIDDTVSMNEFMEKYEILDQQGRIYTIKFKEKEKEND